MTEVLTQNPPIQPYLKDNLSQTSTQSSTDPPQLPDLPLQPNQPPLDKLSNTKAKSSLCRNFMEKGTCPYGSKCQFAHGTLQLKCNSEQQMLYKTRPCHAFEKKGFCLYGYRCNFLHRGADDEKIQGKFIKIRDIIYETRKKKGSKILQFRGFL